MYVTLEQVKANLELDTDEHDELLIGYIQDATDTVRKATQREYMAMEETRYFTGDDEAAFSRAYDLLYVGTDIAALLEVTNGDGTVLFSRPAVGQPPTVGAREVITEPRNITPFNIIRLRTERFTRGVEYDIAVKAMWGYSLTPTRDIVKATERLALWYYRQKTSGDNADRTTVSDGVYMLPARLPKDVMELLQTELPMRMH